LTVKKNLFWPGLLMVLTLGVPTATPAETDGYYCVGRDYLAYQLNQPTDSSKQTLILLRLDGQQGGTETRRFEIEAFPVFGMRCLTDAVDLLAGDRIHRITLTNRETPDLGAVEPQPEDSLLPDFTSESLSGGTTASRTIPLAAADGRFTLVIERPAPDSKPNGRSFLRQQMANGEVRDYPLYPERDATHE
jgi:hypothetical protein